VHHWQAILEDVDPRQRAGIHDRRALRRAEERRRRCAPQRRLCPQNRLMRRANSLGEGSCRLARILPNCLYGARERAELWSSWTMVFENLRDRRGGLAQNLGTDTAGVACTNAVNQQPGCALFKFVQKLQ
jgi:hypothetical protein